MLFRFQDFVIRHRAELRIVTLIFTVAFSAHFCCYADPGAGG
jgi:hypothetical protein